MTNKYKINFEEAKTIASKIDSWTKKTSKSAAGVDDNSFYDKRTSDVLRTNYEGKIDGFIVSIIEGAYRMSIGSPQRDYALSVQFMDREIYYKSKGGRDQFSMWDKSYRDLRKIYDEAEKKHFDSQTKNIKFTESLEKTLDKLTKNNKEK